MAHVQTRGRTIRRTTAGIAAVVALMAGIAVAFFLTTQDFTGQNADTGILSIDTSLSQDFDWNPGAALFPRESEPDRDGVTVEFGNTQNPEAERISYDLRASAFACSQDLSAADPAGSYGPTPNADCTYGSNAAQLAEDVQVKVYEIVEESQNPADAVVDEIQSNDPAVYYTGSLQGLQDNGLTAPVLVDNGETVEVGILVWLKNNDTESQPQGTTITWTFTAEARTPGA